MKKILLVLLAILSCGISAFGADTTYYLCQSGNGTDYTNPACCAATPSTCWTATEFNSLSSWSGTDNADKIDPGDTVVILPDKGTFTSSLTFPGEGNSGANVTLKGADPSVLIDCTGNSSCVAINGKQYLTVKDLTITGASTANVFSAGTAATAANGYLTLDNLTVYGAKTSVYITSYSNSSYSNLNLSVTGAAHGDGTYVLRLGWNTTNKPSNITVSNLTASGGGKCVSISDATSVTASNINASNGMQQADTGTINFYNLDGTNSLTSLTSTGGADNGIRFDTLSGTLTVNTLASSGSMDGAVMFNAVTATLAGAVTGINIGSGAGIGVHITDTSGLTISGARISGRTGIGGASIFGAGIQIDGTSSNNAVKNSEISYCAWDGVSLKGTGTGTLVEGNNIHHNGTLGELTSGNGFTAHNSQAGVVVRYNTIHHNVNGLAVIDASGGEIYMNSIYWNGHPDYAAPGGFTDDCTTPNGPCAGWVLTNNMFKDNYPTEIRQSPDAKAADTLDKNQYIHTQNGVTESAFASHDRGVTTMSWATYHTTACGGSPCEPNSIYLRPVTYGQGEFVSVARPDYIPRRLPFWVFPQKIN